MLELPSPTPESSPYLISEHLDFTETESMTDLRLALIEAMQRRSEHAREIATEYQIQSEAIVDAAPDNDNRSSRRIGANLAMALIQLEAGRVDNCIDDLCDILDDLNGLITSGRADLITVAELLYEFMHELAASPNS